MQRRANEYVRLTREEANRNSESKALFTNIFQEQAARILQRRYREKLGKNNFTNSIKDPPRLTKRH